MDKYRVSIKEKEYLIEVEGDHVWVDGNEVYAGIHFLNDSGLFMIERDEGKREFFLRQDEEDTYQITTRGLQTEVLVQPSNRQGKKQAKKKNTGIVSAPIPGAISEVLVKEGETVEADQILVVLESMKMLMEFRAPSAGTVEKVLVEKGQMVEKGDELVRLKVKE